MPREVDAQPEVEVLQPDTRSDVALTNHSVNGPPMESTPVTDILMSVALASVTSSTVIMPSMPVVDPEEATLGKPHNIVAEG